MVRGDGVDVGGGGVGVVESVGECCGLGQGVVDNDAVWVAMVGKWFGELQPAGDMSLWPGQARLGIGWCRRGRV